MRGLLLLVFGCSFGLPAAAGVYRHVDEAGTVTYSDRPQQPYQQPLNLPPPNVATPEARRQLEIARQASEREAQAEYEVRMHRWAAAQRVAPAAYHRPLSPSTPRFADAAYFPPAYYPAYTTFATSVPAPAPNHAHPARRAGR